MRVEENFRLFTTWVNDQKSALAAVCNGLAKLVVVDMTTRTRTAEIALPGQPDSVARSPDGKYVAVVIENERDEDLGNGAPPQAPGGSLVIVDVAGAPSGWSAPRAPAG